LWDRDGGVALVTIDRWTLAEELWLADIDRIEDSESFPAAWR
jgi:hypothetical protein